MGIDVEWQKMAIKKNYSWFQEYKTTTNKEQLFPNVRTAIKVIYCTNYDKMLMCLKELNMFALFYEYRQTFMHKGKGDILKV